MKKNVLAMAVMATVFAGGALSVAPAVQAEEMSHDMNEVVIEGEKDVLPGGLVATKGSVGILGEKDVMEIPFSVKSLTEKQIENFAGPNQPLDSVLVGVPSVRQAGSVLHNDFTLRGFRANGTSTYVNGVHGVLTQFNFPMYPFGKIDVLSGPNSIIGGTGVQYESSTAGGVINVQSKKAGEDPMLKYKQTFSGKGSLGEYLDMSKRFGKNNEWGVRINTEYLDGETSVDETDMEAKGVFVNIDHRDEMSTTNFFAGYRDIDIYNGIRWFKLGGGVTEMPDAIDGSKNYGFEGMHKGAYGGIMVLNHEQKINDDWKVFFNGGYSKQKLNHNVMAKSSAYTIKNNNGDFDLAIMQGATPQKSYYAQFGTNGQFATGNVEHDITFSVDKAWRNKDGANGFDKDGVLGSGNINTGIIDQNRMPVVGYTTYKDANKTSIWGVSLIDTMTFDKWSTIVGVHKHEGTVTTHNKDGKQTGHTVSDATSPVYAITYSPVENVAIYGSHAENFDIGKSDSSEECLNAGEILPPSKTKQNEIGIKYQNKGLLTTLAFFDIDQANNVKEYTGNHVNIGGSNKETYYYRQNGKVNHKGVELSVSGKIAPKWNTTVGIAYLDAQYKRTQKGTLDGVQVSGQPKWTGAATLEYQADEDFSVLGRAVYTGSSPFFNTNKSVHFEAPSYMVYDLGVNYRTHLGDIPTKLSLMCYNLFDKDYWMVSRGDQIYASTPRTFFLSAEFDL